MNYYRRFPGDYGRDTQHLTFEQHGAYNLLLDIAYTTEKPLPFDRELIYRMTRAISPSEKLSIDLVIEQFFAKSRWGFVHKRVCEEIKYAESRIKTARENGSLGGRPKATEKPDGLFEGKPKPNLEKSSPDSRLQTPEEALKERKPNNAPAAPEVVPVSLWLSFVEMRKKIRKPLTERAGEMIRNKLRWFQTQGADPIDILEQSVMNSWAGVFPVKGNGNGQHESFEERRKRKSAEAIRDVRRNLDDVVREMERPAILSGSDQAPTRRLRGSVDRP